MHWLLDIHFGEDFCQIENEGAQQVLNVVREIALDCVKAHKQKSISSLPLSKIMFPCPLNKRISRTKTAGNACVYSHPAR